MKPIKNKLYKLSLSLFISILVISLFVAGTEYANAAGAASFTADTTVALDVGNLTITSGSDADSVTTSNTQVTVGISSGQSFTLDSSDRFLLTNDSGYAYDCLSNKSTITITSSTTKTVIITPSSNTCGTGGGGGGGGGSSGGSSGSSGATIASATTPTPTLTPSVSPAVSATPTPVSTPATVPGSISLLPTGSTAKLFRKVKDSKIYVQKDDGTLSWVKTLEEFNANKYKWSNVKVVSAKEFAKLQAAKPKVIATPTPTPLVSKKYKVFNTSYLNVRSSASTSSSLLGKLPRGTVIESLDQQGLWHKIKYQTKDGWVHSSYLQMVK